MSRSDLTQEEIVDKIKGVALNIKHSVEKNKAPILKTPVRSLSNVDYDAKAGYFTIGSSEKERKLNASSVKTFAQTMLLLNEAKKVVQTNDIMTKREAYYVSKNWGDAKFNEQPESDTVMDDIEAMLRIQREQLGFIPEEKGGDVAGDLVVIDQDPSTGENLRIDCTKFGSGAYSVPSDVEHLEFETTAKFILAIETAGMFQRLVKHGYWKSANCVLVSMGGVPTRSCRRFIRRLADDKELPVFVFCDGDPYGMLNIYRTLSVGSGNAAHINEFFCVPQAKYIGITPDDIEEYDLPTHPLKDVDIKRIKDGLKNDPFVQHHTSWQKALKKLLHMGVRAEQQALAKHGLNFVISDYLPQKLANPNSWLD